MHFLILLKDSARVPFRSLSGPTPWIRGGIILLYISDPTIVTKKSKFYGGSSWESNLSALTFASSSISVRSATNFSKFVAYCSIRNIIWSTKLPFLKASVQIRTKCVPLRDVMDCIVSYPDTNNRNFEFKKLENQRFEHHFGIQSYPSYWWPNFQIFGPAVFQKSTQIGMYASGIHDSWRNRFTSVRN